MMTRVDLWQMPVQDVRPLLVEERADLLDLLVDLAPEEWTAATAAPGWTVKDLALHLLDDDLGWLSRGRDGDRSGLLDMSQHEIFVAALAAKNQRWVEGAQGLSREVVVGLLRWAGEQMDAYYGSLDLMSEGYVSWASDQPVPQWFDIAQDLTERWVHQLQMRQAVARPGGYPEKYLPLVLRTFVWAVPHQYRVAAPAGTSVEIDLTSGGRWAVNSLGEGRWRLSEGAVQDATARVSFSDEAGWRWFTGALTPDHAVSSTGSTDLVEPLMSVRGIIA
jgi:uncharacterized protein (TIGR03083 family)